MNEVSPLVEPGLIDHVIIRYLTEADLPALEWGGRYTHFRQVFAHAFRRMQQGLSLLWVADLPGEGVIGQVFVQLTCDRPELADGYRHAYLYSFRIKQPYRGLGIGSKMLNFVEQEIRGRGFTSITLNVAKENDRARRLYIRHGYRVAAHEPGVWSFIDDKGSVKEVVEPAWRMEKILKAES